MTGGELMATPAAGNAKFSVTSRSLGLAGATSDAEGEARGRVEHPGPDLEAAISEVRPIPVSAGKRLF